MNKNIISMDILSINKNNLSEKKIRINFYDNLRIISSFAVIMIHVSAHYYYKCNINSLNWKITLYFDGLSRFSVPIFFMISGDFF